ncbi:protein FAM204A [Cololabis saira]|uniref:protein FAM204A n=1 Tax=Cololabis saira TaxID=129043 RepID=UPI002AD3CCBB|nr:protein FAM204A [Cololabis saira]
MYSGLLPKGFTDDDLSADEEEDVDEEKLSAADAATAASLIPDLPASDSVIDAPIDALIDNPACSLPGVSQDMWQKFQELRKKKEEFKATKIPQRRKRRRHRKGTKSEEPAEMRQHQEKQEKHWNELTQYFGVNDRFQPPACSKPAPKSGLERNIEKSIAEGDFEKAEEMSDRLATREMAVKITKAADCRDFVKLKQEEEALLAAQKRKKDIPWGFEAKKRWETKSNMGYM